MNPAGWWSDIRHGLIARPGRTALVTAGVAVSLCSVTATTGALALIQTRMGELRALFGADVMALTPRRSDAVFPRAMTGLFRANLPGTTVSGVRLIRDPSPQASGPDLAAVDEDWFRVRPQRIVAGRALDPEDIRRAEPCAVLPFETAREFGLKIGGTFSAEGRLFTVVGVTDRAGSADFGLGRPLALVPWTAAPPAADTSAAGDTISALFLRASAGDQIPRLSARANRLAAGTDFQWHTPESQTDQWARLRRSILRFAGLMTAALMAAATAGLAATLAGRVRARAREIGLRRALGATPTGIAAWILGEAGIVLGVGLLVSWTAGLGALRILRLPMDDYPAILLPAIAVSSGFALLMLLLAAGAPAWKAARLHPAEALRQD